MSTRLPVKPPVPASGSVDPSATPAPTPGPLGRRGPASTGWLAPRRTGLGAAVAAFVVGLLNAAVSVYWGLGGTWLLATVGGSLPRQGRAGTAILVLAVWAAVVIKMVATVLPLLALRRVTSTGWDRAVSLLAWTEAGILTVYGLVLTVVGILVQAGTIHPSAGADHRALAWHAYLWDPWFLLWGLLVAGALRGGRHPHSQAEAGVSNRGGVPTAANARCRCLASTPRCFGPLARYAEREHGPHPAGLDGQELDGGRSERQRGWRWSSTGVTKVRHPGWSSSGPRSASSQRSSPRSR